MVKHPPYVEEATERLEETPVSGGIDTTAVDCLRQGVSIRNARHRYCGTQPKIWAGNTSHHLLKQVFGVPGMYPDGDAFDDTGKQFGIEAVIDHFASGSVSVSEAFMGAGDDDGQIESFDGVIEPFEIRNDVLRPGQTVITKRFRSQFTDGNIARSGGGDQVRQERFCGIHIESSPYLDQGPLTSSFPRIQIDTTGSDLPRLTKPLPEQEKMIAPFDDTRGVTPSLAKSLVVSGSGREHLLPGLIQLSGSTIVEELHRRMSATAGIVYHDSPCGTNSITYGGMTRYKAFGDS